MFHKTAPQHSLHIPEDRYVQHQGKGHGGRAQINQTVDNPQGQTGENQENEQDHIQKGGAAFSKPLGAVELLALAQGGLRVMKGEEEAKAY